MVTLGIAYHPLETLDARAKTLAELSVILAEVGSDHALIGGIAVGYHGRLRATVDVDLLVPRAKLGPLARAFGERGYVVTETYDMVRVYPAAADPDDAEAIADLVAREANPCSRRQRAPQSLPRCSDIEFASCRVARSSR